MQTTAIVTEVNESYAIVLTERTAACDGCHKAEEGGCSVCSLMASNRKMSAKAINEVGASVGDLVVVESDTGRMLWYAALIFLLPLVAAILVWGIVASVTDSVVMQAVGGFGGFLVSLFSMCLYSRAVKNRRCEIRITEILKKQTLTEEN